MALVSCLDPLHITKRRCPCGRVPGRHWFESQYCPLLFIFLYLHFVKNLCSTTRRTTGFWKAWYALKSWFFCKLFYILIALFEIVSILTLNWPFSAELSSLEETSFENLTFLDIFLSQKGLLWFFKVLWQTSFCFSTILSFCISM